MAKQIANPDLPAPPSGKYPAKSHCRRVAKWLAENGGPEEGVIYLEGQALREHEVCCLGVCGHVCYEVHSDGMLVG
jgi:Xaa-Pro dipeptidase